MDESEPRTVRVKLRNQHFQGQAFTVCNVYMKVVFEVKSRNKNNKKPYAICLSDFCQTKKKQSIYFMVKPEVKYLHIIIQKSTKHVVQNEVQLF